MSHYWTADDPPATREGQVEDWIQDLMEFDLDIVADACAEWRRKPVNRRPLPGEIRAMCFAEQEARKEKQLAIEDKNRQQDGGSWEPWLYEIWGPASTGRIARQQALDDWNRRVARGQAYREGRLAEFDAGLGDQQGYASGKNFRFTDQEIRERFEYARLRGYETWGDFLIALEAGKESMLPFYDWANAQRPGPKLASVKGFRSLGEVLGNLGVSSTEQSPRKPYDEQEELGADHSAEWQDEWNATMAAERRAKQLEAPPIVKPAPRSPLASYPEDPT